MRYRIVSAILNTESALNSNFMSIVGAGFLNPAPFLYDKKIVLPVNLIYEEGIT